jgi:hypothetical protein
MKNTKSILLSLFLLLPVAIQSMELMEDKTVAKPKSIRKIKKDRDKIYQEILTEERLRQLERPYFKASDQYYSLNPILFQDQNDLTVHSFYHNNFRFKGCSYLGLATMRIKRPNFTYEDRYGGFYNYCLIRNPKQASFKEKKETIQLLKKNKVKKTRKDKRFAFLAKYEEFAPTIIQKILILQNLFLSSIRQEIIKNIALLMWETEESLL